MQSFLKATISKGLFIATVNQVFPVMGANQHWLFLQDERKLKGPPAVSSRCILTSSHLKYSPPPTSFSKVWEKRKATETQIHDKEKQRQTPTVFSKEQLTLKPKLVSCLRNIYGASPKCKAQIHIDYVSKKPEPLS